MNVYQRVLFTIKSCGHFIIITIYKLSNNSIKSFEQFIFVIFPFETFPSELLWLYLFLFLNLLFFISYKISLCDVDVSSYYVRLAHFIFTFFSISPLYVFVSFGFLLYICDTIFYHRSIWNKKTKKKNWITSRSKPKAIHGIIYMNLKWYFISINLSINL